MTLMKNSAEIKDTLSSQSTSDSNQNKGWATKQRLKTNPSRFIGRKALAASLALSLSFGLVPGGESNQAQAASLADLFSSAETQGGQEKFLKVDQAFSVKPSQSGNKVNIALKITPKHYLYKDKLSLKLPEGVTASAIKFSHTPQNIDDPTFGKVDVFKQPQVTATATLTNTTAAAINEDITVTWQGCADAGLCYPPQTETLAISLPASTSASAAGQKKSSEETATPKSKESAAAKSTTSSSKAAASEKSASTEADTSAKPNNNSAESQQKAQTATIAAASATQAAANETTDESHRHKIPSQKILLI